jgi:hypothetical protein
MAGTNAGPAGTPTKTYSVETEACRRFFQKAAPVINQKIRPS